MLKHIALAALIATPTLALANDPTIADQVAKTQLGLKYEQENKPMQACKAFAEAEEMGYLGDLPPENRTDPRHNSEYIQAGLKFAECLQNNKEFAKPYNDDGLYSVTVYSTLNEVYHSKQAQDILNKEMTILATEASKLRSLPNKEILTGSERASLACSAAHTAYNTIGFTGRENEKKNTKINRNFVSTGIALAFCNIYHPYYAKEFGTFISTKEAHDILTSLSTEYGSNEASAMLKMVKPMYQKELGRYQEIFYDDKK